MKFRRSIKNEKHDSAKPAQFSLPHKDAIAIEAPKKVIKAIYDYSAPADAPQGLYLSFSAGDFLHVVSRENDRDWYEACNPLRNERGLVPVAYFQDIGKTVRDSGDSVQSAANTSHDSGYADSGLNHENAMTSAARYPSAGPHNQPGPVSSPARYIDAGPHNQQGPTSAARTSANGTPTGVSSHRPTKSLGKSSGGLYGVVMFDFKAERPDELDAKAGEPIIVIAQSNPEWFVAKPITRLGGPGLIPVSFVEVRDMTTGEVAEDALAAVQAAGIPRVEEWKKMAAEYKNTSIPLGTVTSSQQLQGLQQSMDRMSLNNAQHNAQGHQRHQSHSLQSQQEQSLYAPERASVPRYAYIDEKFHFIVECRLSNGTHWDLSRVYEDFYELQINLINAFPEEAGQVPGKQRKLPYMPGPVKYVTDNLTEGRRANLDEYLRDLLKLDRHIVASSLVRAFFAPRENDYEVNPNSVDIDSHARAADPQQLRYSHHSQTSHVPANQYFSPSAPTNTSSLQSQSRYQQPNLQGPSQAPRVSSSTHQRAQPSQGSASFASLPTQQQVQVQVQQQNSTQTFQPPAADLKQLQGTMPVKMKCWFDRDTCVVLRMPPAGQFDYKFLWAKCIERRRLEFKDHPADQQEEEERRLMMEYRDERSGNYFQIASNEDLFNALVNNGEKMTIAVRDRDFEGE